MNDPLTWISLFVAVLLGLPNAIEGYMKLLAKRRKRKG